MTSHSLNLANDVVNLTRQKAEIEQKILDAREEVTTHITEIAIAAGMIPCTPIQKSQGFVVPAAIGFYWPNP